MSIPLSQWGAAAVVLAAISSAMADHSEDHQDAPMAPADWYATAYAPLWNETPAAAMDKILAHYADDIVTHAIDGAVTRDPQQAWLAEPMAEWVDAGWLRAELVDLETREINASTASFIATWKDHYQDGSTEVSCGWYLADLTEGEWKITEYADTHCP